MKRMFLALAIASCAAAPALAQALPDRMAVKRNGADGWPTLAGWVSTPAPKSADLLRTPVHIEPGEKTFAGAKAFLSATRDADAVTAAKKAAAAEGFETTKVLAEVKTAQPVMDRLEKGSLGTSLMLEGRMAGKPARFIGTVWYGARGEPDGKAASGVHGFVAPEPVFVALGGYAVPAILFANARATPDTPMSVDGAKPPQQQTKELSDLFAQWANTLPAAGSADNLSTLNGIMQGNLGVQSGTGCINTLGCVGGGTAPVYTPRY